MGCGTSAGVGGSGCVGPGVQLEGEGTGSNRLGCGASSCGRPPRKAPMGGFQALCKETTKAISGWTLNGNKVIQSNNAIAIILSVYP